MQLQAKLATVSLDRTEDPVRLFENIKIVKNQFSSISVDDEKRNKKG